MAYMLIRHKVENYDTWRAAFDSYQGTRTAKGEKSFKLFRDSEDSNEVTALFEWDSIENAKEFINSDDLKEKMQEAGVAEKPDIHFLNEA